MIALHFDCILIVAPFPEVAVVSQDCVLFARSIRENIKYGYEEASEEEVHRAAQLAGAHDFIMKLTNGYDTGGKPSLQCITRVPFQQKTTHCELKRFCCCS